MPTIRAMRSALLGAALVSAAGLCTVPAALAGEPGPAGQPPVVIDEPVPAEEPFPAPAEAAPADDEDQAYLHRVAWVGFGMAAVGVVTWAVTGSIALAQAGQLEEDCPEDLCSPDVEDDLDTARSLAHAATAGLVIGVLGGITGAIALIVAEGDNEDASDGGDATTTSVGAIIAPGYLGLHGRF